MFTFSSPFRALQQILSLLELEATDQRRIRIPALQTARTFLLRCNRGAPVLFVFAFAIGTAEVGASTKYWHYGRGRVSTRFDVSSDDNLRQSG